MAFNLVQHFTAKHNAEFVFMMIYYSQYFSYNKFWWLGSFNQFYVSFFLSQDAYIYIVLEYRYLLPVALFDDAQNSEIVLALPNTENISIWL